MVLEDMIAEYMNVICFALGLKTALDVVAQKIMLNQNHCVNRCLGHTLRLPFTACWQPEVDDFDWFYLFGR